MTAPALPHRFSASLVLPANCFKYEIDSSRKAALKVVRAESRGNSIANNLVAGDVGQRPFQPVARLDSHPVIVHENEKDSAVVSPLLPDLPYLESALGKVFDRTLRRHCPPDSDYNLIGGFALKLRQLFVETLSRPGRNDTGVIVEITVGFRRNCFGGVRDDRAGENHENSKIQSCSLFRRPEQN